MGYGAAQSVLKLFIAVMLTLGVAKAESVTIAALGDSLTQGYGLPVDQGLVPTLERWLQTQGQDVRIMNAGVSGDTTAGGLARIDWTLTPDVQGLIVALGANDMLRGLPPEAAKNNLDGILEAAQRAGIPALLVGVPAPSNYGSEYKDEFDGIFPALAKKHNAIFALNLLAPLESSEVPLTDLLQSDRLHPNAQGVELIVNGLAPFVLDLIEEIRK